MTRIAILVEGGGKSTGRKNLLRTGFNAFFRDISESARNLKVRWDLSVCGSRGETFRDFHIARKDKSNTHVFLLVDSDGPVTTGGLAYLTKHAGFKNLSNAEDRFIHLMIHAMEAWIIADPAALAKYYGQHFAQSALPKAINLETVAKADLENAFKQAIAKTGKPEYDKIHDASQLLARINPAIVHQRCPSSHRFFDEVRKAVAAA